MNLEAFMPHRYCMADNPALLIPFLYSNLALFICYWILGVFLVVFAYAKRGEYISKFHAVFSVFVFFCGTTHLMSAITLYYPIYWIQLYIDCATAVFSAVAVIMVFKFFVPLRDLPKRSSMQEMITGYQNKMAELKAAFDSRVEKIRYYQELHKKNR